MVTYANLMVAIHLININCTRTLGFLIALTKKLKIDIYPCRINLFNKHLTKKSYDKRESTFRRYLSRLQVLNKTKETVSLIAYNENGHSFSPQLYIPLLYPDGE